MSELPLQIVTGGLGYSGRSIAQRLLARRHRVRTLTNSNARYQVTDVGVDELRKVLAVIRTRR